MKISEGWAIKYNSLSRPLAKTQSGRAVYEMFMPDAFAESVAAINAGAYTVKMNVEHSQNSALTKLGSSSYNLSFENKPEGVYVRWAWLDDSLSSDLQKKVDAALITGLSIEFQGYPGEEPSYQADATGNYIRVFKRAVLNGIAIVDEPAYPESRIVTAAPAPIFSRSVNASDVEKILSEVDEMERQKGLINIYENYSWLWSHKSA